MQEFALHRASLACVARSLKFTWCMTCWNNSFRKEWFHTCAKIWFGGAGLEFNRGRGRVQHFRVNALPFAAIICGGTVFRCAQLANYLLLGVMVMDLLSWSQSEADSLRSECWCLFAE